VTFTYEMSVGERRLATGYTKHVFVSREMRPTHLPQKYHELFGI
jgi:acyl-CoA thioesterase FadM